MTDSQLNPFVSRGGLKLRHALDAFSFDPRGMRCADFGANVGGFTDCLLQAGAPHVTAIDTGYGVLAWKLRKDPRVTVLERTNALHAPPPTSDIPHPTLFDLVVIDMAWTPQRLCIPAALKWLKPDGRIITLIKPHYEVEPEEKGLLTRGVLPLADAERIAAGVLESMPGLGVEVVASTQSPVQGGAGKKNTKGNTEWLALLRPARSQNVDIGRQ